VFNFDTLSQYFLAIYFTIIAIHYSSVALGRKARTQQKQVHAGQPMTAQWWVRQTFNVFRTLILLLCIARVGWDIDGYLGVFDVFYQPVVVYLGVTLMLLSLFLVSFSHAYMQAQWRSGIDDNTEHPLLVEGPFKRTRNPIFKGILLGQLGLFLVFPSVFTLLCLVTGISMLVLQVQHEETALEQSHGEVYLRYKSTTPRWL
jgi:protein-S-isoprenylcysteine O-methyltransferase Ste14